MSDINPLEPWLRGTMTDVNPVIRAVLHALELAREDVLKWCYPLTLEQLNRPVASAAPVSFHLKHIARSLDRLLTYAECRALDEEQFGALRTEKEPASRREALFEELSKALEQSKERLRSLAGVDFGAPRTVGKKQLPTTVGGLLVHIADHTQRHAGQAITTAKIVSSL
ncbi:MAG TPA: DinB family protein [Dongiaceae bacterium]|nr:DinB family protein [Dongiaceae bacterium]